MPFLRVIKFFLVLVTLGCACLSVSAKGVCPVRNNEKVQQIDIFDGTSEELAYLAPDDNEKAPNTYTLTHIYEKGRTVTIHCTYDSGFVFDLSLKKKVNRCNFSRSKSGTLALVCK